MPHGLWLCFELIIVDRGSGKPIRRLQQATTPYDTGFIKDMKALALVALVGVCLGCPNMARAQAAFQNLGFEMAEVPDTPGWGTPISRALPHWKGFAGTLAAFGVMYDMAFLDSPQIGVYDGLGYLPEPMFGDYSVFLMADVGWMAPKAEIFQTGFILAESRSLRFATSPQPIIASQELRREDWSLSLLVNGVAVPYVALETTSAHIIWGADISSQAGQTAEIRFSLDTALTPDLREIGVAVGLDEIGFSPTAIPAPALVHLLLLAFGMAYLNNTRRRHKMITTHADLESRSEVRTCAGMIPDF